MKTIILILLSTTLLINSGCSNSKIAAASAWGKRHRVTLFSGGKEVGQWITSGKIENEHQSNGYYFQDDKTKKVILINGDVIIEVLD